MELSSCYVTNQFVGTLSVKSNPQSNPTESMDEFGFSNTKLIYMHMNDRFQLIMSYMDFVSGLFYFIKEVQNDSELMSKINESFGFGRLFVESIHLIRGCLFFVIRYLLGTYLNVDYWLHSSFNRGRFQANGIFDGDECFGLGFDQFVCLGIICVFFGFLEFY